MATLVLAWCVLCALPVRKPAHDHGEKVENDEFWRELSYNTQLTAILLLCPLVHRPRPHDCDYDLCVFYVYVTLLPMPPPPSSFPFQVPFPMQGDKKHNNNNIQIGFLVFYGQLLIVGMHMMGMSHFTNTNANAHDGNVTFHIPQT